MKLLHNEEILICKKKEKTMSNRKLVARKQTGAIFRSEIRKKNVELIEVSTI